MIEKRLRMFEQERQLLGLDEHFHTPKSRSSLDRAAVS